MSIERVIQIQPPAIVIEAIDGVIPPAMGVELQMRHAKGIDHGHDDDFTMQAAFGFGSFQHGQEVMQDQHARLFIGMQAGLHIDFLPLASRAETIILQGK